MWWIHLLKIFTCWILYWWFRGMDHMVCGSLVPNHIAVTKETLPPPNILRNFGALSPSTPLISVHGALTIARIWGSYFIIYHWLGTRCFGEFPNFLPKIPKSCMMRKLLHLDGVYSVLAINGEALPLIPQYIYSLEAIPIVCFSNTIKSSLGKVHEAEDTHFTSR